MALNKLSAKTCSDSFSAILSGKGTAGVFFPKKPPMVSPIRSVIFVGSLSDKFSRASFAICK